MNKQEAIEHFTNATHECLALAAQHYPEIAQALAQTQIKFDIRAGRTLGQAVFHRTEGWTRIRYNLAAAMINPAKFADTVPHEVAHIVCYLRGRGKGHCWIWKGVCDRLGGDAQRVCEPGHFPGLKRRERGARYYRWVGPAVGAVWVKKREHLALTETEWVRTRCGLTHCTTEKVMTKDELRAIRLEERVAEAQQWGEQQAA